MHPLLALAVTVGLLVVATAVGFVWRARLGRIRTATAQVVTAADLDIAEPLGRNLTLVQFSTEFCAPCRSTHRVLAQLADRTDGVAHLDIDLTHRTDLATRFNILQTPTTLVLDDGGHVRGRIGGAPRVGELTALVNEILEGTHVGLVKSRSVRQHCG